MDQLALLGSVEAPAADAAGRVRRATSKGIAPGDIVEVDRKGRRFHAVVTSVEQRDSGLHDLGLRPIDGRTTYRSATVREVVGVWRKVSRPAPAAAPAA